MVGELGMTRSSGPELEPGLQLELRQRPETRRAMVQKWRDLTFLHYSVEPDLIQAKLPPGLTVDTFNGKAWIGMVPFWMTGIRFPWAPTVPGTHTFPETNVRTYVHRSGKEPGVWFFSLDAANALAVAWARRFFNLPYHLSKMSVELPHGQRLYHSARASGKASLDLEISLGDHLPLPKPGSFEFWLVERYLLYAVRGGRLYSGLVNHAPYQLQSARVLRCEQSLLESNGLPSLPWEHVCFSPGVDVDIFPLRRL